MRTKVKEKSLTPAGFEPTTSGLKLTITLPTELRGQTESRYDQNISSRSSSRTQKQGGQAGHILIYILQYIGSTQISKFFEPKKIGKAGPLVKI